RCVRIRTQGRVACIDTVPIDIPLGSGSSILHVIGTLVLGKPGSFDVSAQYGVGMIVPKALPTVLFRIQVEELYFLSRTEAPVFVQGFTPDGEFVGRAPEKIGLRYVINEQGRILQIIQNGRNGFPIAGK